MFDLMKATFALRSLHNGKLADLSDMQIVNMIIGFS